MTFSVNRIFTCGVFRVLAFRPDITFAVDWAKYHYDRLLVFEVFFCDNARILHVRQLLLLLLLLILVFLLLKKKKL